MTGPRSYSWGAGTLTLKAESLEFANPLSFPFITRLLSLLWLEARALRGQYYWYFGKNYSFCGHCLVYWRVFSSMAGFNPWMLVAAPLPLVIPEMSPDIAKGDAISTLAENCCVIPFLSVALLKWCLPKARGCFPCFPEARGQRYLTIWGKVKEYRKVQKTMPGNDNEGWEGCLLAGIQETNMEVGRSD